MDVSSIFSFPAIIAYGNWDGKDGIEKGRCLSTLRAKRIRRPILRLFNSQNKKPARLSGLFVLGLLTKKELAKNRIPLRA